jgi:hypothetical protein
VRDKVSHPYKTTGKNYIPITFLSLSELSWRMFEHYLKLAMEAFFPVPSNE